MAVCLSFCLYGNYNDAIDEVTFGLGRKWSGARLSIYLLFCKKTHADCGDERDVSAFRHIRYFVVHVLVEMISDMIMNIHKFVGNNKPASAYRMPINSANAHTLYRILYSKKNNFYICDLPRD